MKTPKIHIWVFILAWWGLQAGLSGCNTSVSPDSGGVFDPPRNVFVVPGHNEVEIHWSHHRSVRITGYRVYRSRSYDGRFTYLGSTNLDYFVDRSARNGNRYYYAVSGFDSRGNETDLSTEYAFTIPRPEGYDVLMYDFRLYPDIGGFEFSTATLGPYDDLHTDIFFEYHRGVHYMNVWDDTDIQDMGYTRSIKDITMAPELGWSPTKDVILRKGHTYVVWTFDDHFAKFRIFELGGDYVVFDWAYQTLAGEPLLKREPAAKNERVLRSRKYNIGVD